jgi:hypothetical protein
LPDLPEHCLVADGKMFASVLAPKSVIVQNAHFTIRLVIAQVKDKPKKVLEIYLSSMEFAEERHL